MIESLLDHAAYQNIAFGDAAKSIIKSFLKHENGYYISLDSPKIRLKLKTEASGITYRFEIFKKPDFLGCFRNYRWENVVMSKGFVEGYSFAKFSLEK